MFVVVSCCAIVGQYRRASSLPRSEKQALEIETSLTAMEDMKHITPSERALALSRTANIVIIGSGFRALEAGLVRRLTATSALVSDLLLLYCRRVLDGLSGFFTVGNDMVSKL